MGRQEPTAIPEDRRKQIFLALVETQDTGVPTVQSRALMCEKFTVSEEQVRQIEREGIDQEWPPL